MKRRDESKALDKTMPQPMERSRLVELLRMIASNIASVDFDKALHWSWVVRQVLLDYCEDEAIMERHNEALKAWDVDAGCAAFDEALDAIFDIEITDLYLDVCEAMGRRPIDYIC